MAEKLTDQQVVDLLAILRKDVAVDAKVQKVTTIKSGIKQHNVPDTCVPQLFDALRLASASPHSALINAGFTALNHLITRMSRQEPKLLSREAKSTLPLIVDKMGDQKDKLRGLATQAMTTMYGVVPAEVERFVRNVVMVGKNPRAKEAGLQWLLQMHKEQGLQFRAYVPTLMELLEDADPMVRDTAKTTVIELFRGAPNAAKSDLKRQLKNFKVRPAIESAIVKELAPTAAGRLEPETRPDSAPLVRPNLAASVSSLSSERPTTPMPAEARAEAVEPTYVNTQRELDDIFREMQMWFDGKETEHNWMKREQSMTKLRRLIAGNAPSDFPDQFITGCRGLLDGIIKSVTSLRTSLSKEGCALVQDIAITFGPMMDPMVELLMQTFIKLAAATKKISSQLANVTVDTIIGKSTYTPRIMQHIWGACQDKNVQPRTYASGWLKTLIRKEQHHKSHVEHGGGLDLLEKCIKKGLADANPGVRERMRSTYWTFATVWPLRAEAIMNGLDATAQKLLQKDANNPNTSKRAETAPRPGLGLSKSTMSTSKPSLRETMMASKKAMATRNVPSRPGSAMATMDSMRKMSHSSTISTVPTTRPRAEPHGGMSVAPMRPARRRPEMAPRPATAGPYSGRNLDDAALRSSPVEVRAKAVTPKTISGSPKRTVPRTRPKHQPTQSESSIPTPTKPAANPPVASPHVSPRASLTKAKTAPFGFDGGSPSRSNEGFSFDVPSIAELQESPTLTSPKSLSPKALSPPKLSSPSRLSPKSPSIAVSEPEQAVSTPSKLQVYEDPFTVEHATPRPVSNGSPERPALEDKPVNEDAANRLLGPAEITPTPSNLSPDKTGQSFRLLDSAIKRVQAQTLDVHGFRKLQSITRDGKALFADEKFDTLLTGLFEYLESPCSNIAPEKVQDVKAQILATIKLLLKKNRDSFQPHISRGLEAMLTTRASYDARTHIVSGLELLADELITLGDADEITVTMTKRLSEMDADPASCRSLAMGLHVLKQLIDARQSFMPNEAELQGLAALASRCLESKDSGVRMDAVQLCVALHSRIGEQKLWECLKDVKEDPKSLITYYVVKRQREQGTATA